MRLALVDYGAGNLASVRKALTHVGFDVLLPRGAPDLDACDAIVVPGVGHYEATRALQETFRAAILDGVRRGRPLLGICLGLQWLFAGSDEAPDVPGLGIFDGRCFRLTGPVKVPHVGWNTLAPAGPSRILEGAQGASVYFTHSFAAPVTDAAVAVTTHGVPFASAVERGNIFGLQWHPEKSAEAGLTVLRNFAHVVAGC